MKDAVVVGGDTVVQSSGDPARSKALLHACGHLVHRLHLCGDDQSAAALSRGLCESRRPSPVLAVQLAGSVSVWVAEYSSAAIQPSCHLCVSLCPCSLA